MKIRNKILIAFTIILLLFASGGAIIAFSVTKIAQLNESIQTELIIVRTASDFQRGALLKQSGTYAYLSGNAQIGQAQINEGETLILQSEAALRTLQNSQLTNDTQDKITLMLNGYIHSFETSISTYSNWTITLYERNNQTINDEISGYAQGISSDITQLNRLITNLKDQIDSDCAVATAEIREYSTTTAFMTIIVILATVIIAGVIAVVIAARITRPISELSTIADKVSQGDLNQEINVKTGDEIENLAESFQRMLNAFKMTNAMSQQTWEDDKQ